MGKERDYIFAEGAVWAKVPPTARGENGVKQCGILMSLPEKTPVHPEDA